MNLREINRAKAKELLDTIELGEYIANGKIIKIPPFRDAEYLNHHTVNSMVNYCKTPESTVSTEIFKGSTVDAIIREYKLNPDKKIGVLNFASAKHPGGGFITGAMAQEEALCHASTLYNQLKNSRMYNWNQANLQSGLYNNSMNISDTYFIKDSHGNYLENPIKTFIVTSAAVNNTHLELYQAVQVDEIMSKRMFGILNVFAMNKCDILILGAFGCGVFKNDPNKIAKIWKTLLDEYGGTFEKVVFAIIERHGTSNITAFKHYF